MYENYYEESFTARSENVFFYENVSKKSAFIEDEIDSKKKKKKKNTEETQEE